MSRPLLFVSVFALTLCVAPVTLFAQQNRQQQQQNTSYPNFLSERQDRNNSQSSVWQYDKKYKGGKGPGHGAYITEELVEKDGVTTVKRTYNSVSQYDPAYRTYLQTGKLPDIDKSGNARKTAGAPPLLPTGSQFIYFVRSGNAKSNEATLRMFTPVSIDGCVNVIPPSVKMRKYGNVLAYSVQEGAVTLDKKTQYGHFQCDSASRAAATDIVLNRDELLRDGIKSISLQAANGAMDVYDINVTPDNITLTSRNPATTFKPFTGTARSNPLSYDFYPDNLLILYAPFAPADQDISADIAALAQRKGLAESTILKNGPELYFIDRVGTLAGSLEFGANAYVGSVNAPETYRGPNGPYEQPRAVDIYAKRPGMLD